MAFVDFEKAFDSVEHKSILESLKAAGVRPEYINIIMNIYNRSQPA